MDNRLLLRCKRRRRRCQCTTTSLINCAFILIATMQQQQQHAAATTLVGAAAAAAAAIKENDPEYANLAKYDEVSQNYYRARGPGSDENEHGSTLPAYANYFGVIDPKGGVPESLITNHNLEEFQDATGTTQMERNEGFLPTTLTAAGQHYATAAAAAATTANNIAQNGYPLLLSSESFKLPAGSKIDYEINAGNSDDISSSGSGNSNRNRDDEFEATLPEDSKYHQILQHQQGQHSAQRKQQQAIYNTFGSTHLQQQHHAPFVPNVLHNYYNAYSTTNGGEFPEFRSHYLSDYQLPQFPNYQQNQQLQADYGNEMSLATPAEATYSKRKANYAVNANDKQQQQQTEQQKFVHYANQQQKRQLYSSQRHQQQQRQTAEPSRVQLQVTDSAGHIISMTPSHSRRARDDIDTNDIDSITTNHNINTASEEQQQIDNDLHSMHLQLQQQRQQFAQLQLQLQEHNHLLQQQQQQHQQNLFSPTYNLQKPHIVAENKLPPVTNTVHHSAASAAAVAGIPLGKHVQVTKHLPVLSHYQQHHVPFKQVVPIEIPRPVITTVPRPYPIQIPMPKTVAVPQLKEVKIPIERIKPFPVERNIPYLVERRVPYRVEKQVATPYYYPYPIKVPVVKTIVHRIPHHYQHHHLHQSGYVGGHSSGNSIYAGGHIH